MKREFTQNRSEARGERFHHHGLSVLQTSVGILMTDKTRKTSDAPIVGH